MRDMFVKYICMLSPQGLKMQIYCPLWLSTLQLVSPRARVFIP